MLTIMNVEYPYSNHNRESNEYHCKEKIFSKQWKRKGGRWYNFRNEQEEHRLWQKNGDAKGDFLARVSWQIKDQNWQIGNANTWDDQVDSVEESFTT